MLHTNGATSPPLVQGMVAKIEKGSLARRKNQLCNKEVQELSDTHGEGAEVLTSLFSRLSIADWLND